MQGDKEDLHALMYIKTYRYNNICIIYTKIVAMYHSKIGCE